MGGRVQVGKGLAVAEELQRQLDAEREKNEELSTQKTSLMRKMESLQQDLKKVYVRVSVLTDIDITIVTSSFCRDG